MSFQPLPPACKDCPAYEWGLGYLPPSGPPSSQLILIGTGPTESQAWNQGPPVGERMDGWLAQAGIPKREILVGNLVQCWLPLRKKPTPDGTRDPTRKEMEFCWQAHLKPALDTLSSAKRRVLVPVGLVSSRFFLGLSPDAGVEKYIGTIPRCRSGKVHRNNPREGASQL